MDIWEVVFIFLISNKLILKEIIFLIINPNIRVVVYMLNKILNYIYKKITFIIIQAVLEEVLSIYTIIII